jgi:hypothetical protein
LVDKLKIKETEKREVIIYGPFTNWNPKVMRTVKEFAEISRTTKPNIFNMLVKNLALGPGYDSKDDLIPEHRTYLKKLEAEYKNDTSVNWRRHIAALNKMTDTQFINYEHLID